MSMAENAYPERIIPSETEPGIVSLHLKRYDFALAYCKDKMVLDVASGVGYGSSYLGKAAKKVIGVEIDPVSLGHALLHYASENVSFQRMDAARLEFEDSTFDTVCSFETIEHLQDIEKYLSEIVRVIKKDGIYLVSTPQVPKTTRHPKNPFHFIEFSRRDFEALLRKYFNQIEVYGQRRKQSWLHHLLQKLDILNLRSKLIPSFIVRQSAKALRTTPIAELNLDDILITQEKISMATELVVVCKHPKKT